MKSDGQKTVEDTGVVQTPGFLDHGLANADRSRVMLLHLAVMRALKALRPVPAFSAIQKSLKKEGIPLTLT